MAEGVEVVEEDIWEAEVEAASVDVDEDVEGVEVVVSFTSDLYVFFNIILFPVHTNSVSLVSTWHMAGGRGRGGGGPPNKARGSISEFKGNKITFD